MVVEGWEMNIMIKLTKLDDKKKTKLFKIVPKMIPKMLL